MTNSRRITGEDILGVFEQLDDPNEPLATSEVADVVDCAHRTAYTKLTTLADNGQLQTKKVGAQVRIWWQPQGGDTQTTHPDVTEELLSDEVLELELRSEQIARPLYEVAESDFRISSDGLVSLDDGTQIQYYTARGLPTKTYIELSEQSFPVLDIRLMSSVEDTTKIEVYTEPDTIATVFGEYNGRFKSVEIDEGEAILHGEVPPTVDVSELLTDLRERHPDLELASQRLSHTPHLFQTLVEDALTTRQKTALQLAYFAGYFEWPRISTGEELAARLGITKQTFHYHLRHAEQAVFQHLFDETDHSRVESVSHGGG